MSRVIKMMAKDVRINDILETPHDSVRRPVTAITPVPGSKLAITCSTHVYDYAESDSVTVQRHYAPKRNPTNGRTRATAQQAGYAFDIAKTAAEHKAADKRMGREWVCSCSACVQVRTPVTVATPSTLAQGELLADAWTPRTKELSPSMRLEQCARDYANALDLTPSDTNVRKCIEARDNLRRAALCYAAYPLELSARTLSKG